MTLDFLIYWFTAIRDAVISAKLFQNQSFCWIIVKNLKYYIGFVLVQSWAQNVFIELAGNKFDSNEVVKWTDWSHILSDVQNGKWRRIWY